MGGSKGGLEGLKRIILGGQEGAAFGRGFNPVTGTAKNIIVKGAKGKKGTIGYKPPVRKNKNRKENAARTFLVESLSNSYTYFERADLLRTIATVAS